jgi:hypothetical protein
MFAAQPIPVAPKSPARTRGRPSRARATRIGIDGYGDVWCVHQGNAMTVISAPLGLTPGRAVAFVAAYEAHRKADPDAGCLEWRDRAATDVTSGATRCART